MSTRRYVWTLPEINALPEFGNDSGWFYGLVRNHKTGRVWLYEILPGMGYCSIWPIGLRNLLWIIKDVRTTQIRKRRISVATNQPRRLNTDRLA